MSTEVLHYQAIEIPSLRFDPENPRLPEHVDGSDEQAVLEWMLSDAGLVELMGSIATKGFFPAEPLLVTKSPDEESFLVLEGNRRLAAVLLLLEPQRAPKRKNAVSEMASRVEDRASLERLPCAIFSDRRDVLDYLGYRHITGIKQWEPAAKARYLDSLYREHLSNHGDEVYRYIARLIGSRADYVMRLLGALRLYEEILSSDLIDVEAEEISFSLITLALNYASINAYLGLESLTQENFDTIPHQQLQELAGWLFRERPDILRTQLGESRNMKLLAASVTHEAGLNALRQGETVEEAARATLDVTELLGRALRTARDRVLSAQNLVHRAENTIEISSLLDDISELVDQLRTLLIRKDRRSGRTSV